MRDGEKPRGKLFHASLDASESVRALWGEGIRHTFRRHFHSSLCVGLVEEGIRTLSLRGVTYELRPGTLFLLPPGEPHECRCFGEKGHAYRILLWDSAFLKVLEARNNRSLSGTPAFFEDAALRKEFDAFFSACLGGKRFLFLEKSGSFLRKCIWDSDLLPKEEVPTDERIAFLESHLSAHLSQGTSLDELGELCSLSPWYLQRLFLRRFGVTPGEYTSLLRIRKSLYFLAQGRSCAETALDLGFTDQSHFSRTFKKIMGVPPGKMHLEKLP